MLLSPTIPGTHVPPTNNPRYSRTYLSLYHTSFIGVPPSLLVPGLRFPGDTTPFGGLVLKTLAPRPWHKSVSRLGLESGEANLGIVPSEQTPGHAGASVKIHQETHFAFGRQPLLRSAAEDERISLYILYNRLIILVYSLTI